MQRQRQDSTDNACTVCHDSIHIFAVGHCDHPVCYKCSTRMRVLCDQMDCPICRSPIPQVAFVHEKKLFKDIDLRECIPNRRNKIFYESEEIEDKYLDLLEFRCRKCPNRRAEKTFPNLQTHMRREHQLFACDICLSHLKIFPYEMKFYDRKSLASHRRMGDEDDTSYKGHPLCEFCDTRYLDKDELMKHLRKDHYFCHFCDQVGSNAYYNEYADLVVHFGDSHFLCTEDECASPNTRFTHAFSSEIDLKSHQATVHNKRSKEVRTIDIDIQLAPRRQGHNRGSGLNADDYEDSGSQRNRNRGDRYGNRRRQNENVNLQRALDASLQDSMDVKARPPVATRVPDPVHDFPTLSGAPASNTQIEAQKTAANTKPKDDFPTLGSSSKKPQNPVQGANKNYAAATHYINSRPVVKKEVKENQPVSLGKVKNVTKERWSVHAPDMSDDDYPTLVGRNSHSSKQNKTDGHSSSSWLQKSSVAEVPISSLAEPTISVITKRPDDPEIQPRKSVPVMRPISDENDFPSLGGGATRPESLAGFAKWVPKTASTKKPSQEPRHEKVDDATFELPDSYFKSYEPAAPADTKSNKENNGSKKSIVNKKDFPGLPVKQIDSKSSDRPSSSKQGKGDVKNVEQKPGNGVMGKKSKKSKKGSAEKSLNDIAAGLIGSDMVENKKKHNNKNGAKINSNNSSKDSKLDWFDNPPKELQEKTLNKTQPLDQEKQSSKDKSSFPSVHNMSSSVQPTIPPPGFMSNVLQQSQQSDKFTAPPGFTKSAPPGLSKPVFSVHNYIQPAEFTVRNQNLVQMIRICLETVEDGFDNFKSFSFQFRQGHITAGDYYTNCQLLIGENDFRDIFPELLALLPDINKQQELWFQHQIISSGRSGSKQQFKNMAPCSNCGQIVLEEDSQHHNLQHGDGKDFPSLGGDANRNSSGTHALKGSWIKAT